MFSHLTSSTSVRRSLMVTTDLLSSSYKDSSRQNHVWDTDTNTNLYCDVLALQLRLCLALSTIELHLHPEDSVKHKSKLSDGNTNSCFIVSMSSFILTFSLSTSLRIVFVAVDILEELFFILVVISPRSSDNAARNK